MPGNSRRDFLKLAALLPGMTLMKSDKPKAGKEYLYMGQHRLNPDWMFSNFIVGPFNEFAHAAAFSVADRPGRPELNPIYICGPSGMGKSHLSHAILNMMKQSRSDLIIADVCASGFFNDAIRGQLPNYKKWILGSSDVLFVDNIQVLGRNLALQSEMAKIIREMKRSGRQVIVTADRFPGAIKFSDESRDILEWGLLADIRRADLESREAILAYRAGERRMRLTPKTIRFIAEHSNHSIRELEGNLKRVGLKAELMGKSPNLKIAREVLRV